MKVAGLSLKAWVHILVVWTLAGFSLATQSYLNTKSNGGNAEWLQLFLQQLPIWYLCALLTPLIMFIYDRFPLHINWKKHLFPNIVIGLAILLIVFSHLRLIIMYKFLFQKNVFDFTLNQYIPAFLAQLAWDITVYIFIVAVIFAYKSYMRGTENALQNQELTNQLNEAQLQTLKLQLSPHFLFNTLNTVSGLIRTGNIQGAIQINARLADFLRTSLYTNGDQFVPFGKELALAESYLEIERIRFPDRLTIQKDISAECLSFIVPYFILQPLLENAIKHGISKNAGPGSLRIKASADESALSIEIYNDGWLETNSLEQPGASGIGLRNLRLRLQKTYGSKFNFNLSSDPQRGGVLANLTLPLFANGSY